MNQLKKISIHIGLIPSHPYRVLIIGGSGSAKAILLLNSLKYQQLDIYKIYLFVKDLFASKFQLFINVRENTAIKKLKYLRAFIGYSQTIDDVFENLEDYNPTKKKKVLIVFYGVTADKETNTRFIGNDTHKHGKQQNE